MQWLYFYLPYDAIVIEKTPVSESWHETSVYAPQGYTEEKRLFWNRRMLY
jgi:hypothetical protein